jgi:hypothetical protein
VEFRLENGGVSGDFGQQTAELAHLQAKTMGLSFKAGAGALSLLAALVATGISIPMAVMAGAASAFFLYSSAKGLGRTAAFGREEVAVVRPEIFARRMALAVFQALKETGLLPAKLQERQIVLTCGADGSVRVFLDGSPGESALFSKSLDELLSPVADQRYVVPRYESAAHKGKGSIAFLQAALSPGQPVLAGYHPVPEELGLNRERAAVFQKGWNRHVSRGEMVYLKSPEGQAVLERFGLADPLGVRKHVAAIWR